MSSRLYLFNPTNEMAIANGQTSYMPPNHLQIFEKDLASFPWLLGTGNDYILVDTHAGNSLNHINDMGWETPKIITHPEELSDKQSNLMFSPWGWSPSVYRRFKPFMHNVSSQWQSHPFSKWQSSLAQLLSRETGYKLLETISNIKQETASHFSLIALPKPPLIIEQINDLASVMKKCPPPSVIKTPWSAAGRGLFRIRNQNDNPENAQWVKGMLRKQGKIYIEKMLPKIQDISFQFWIDKSEIKYLGHNYFYADPSGQFGGCAIGHPENHSALFKDTRKIEEAINQAATLLEQGINAMELNKKYTGPAGVDGIFFKDSDGEVKLQPCLEINLRYNMGLANIRLKKRIHPEAIGIWKTENFAPNQWRKMAEENIKQHPPVLMDGKLRKGFLPLVEPACNKQFGAWLILK